MNPLKRKIVRHTKGFDKFPRWISRMQDFAELDPVALKLLIYLNGKRNWESDVTPWTTTQELAKCIGVCWRRARAAERELEALGVIHAESRRREKRYLICHQSPYDHSADNQAPHLAPDKDVHTDASADIDAPSSDCDELSHRTVRKVTQKFPEKHTDNEALPAWLSESDAPGDQLSTPGLNLAPATHQEYE